MEVGLGIPNGFGEFMYLNGLTKLLFHTRPLPIGLPIKKQSKSGL